MGWSRQDVQVDLARVESKIDFVMNAIKIKQVEGFLNPVEVVKTMHDLWIEACARGFIAGQAAAKEEDVIDVSAEPVANATD